MPSIRRLCILSLAFLIGCASVAPAPLHSPEVDEALALAGDNRGELERVLAHFSGEGADPAKYDAACFLIGNMPGHGYSRYALLTAEGDEVEFDALAYKGFGEAQAALDALEKEHGTLEFRPQELIADLDVIGADFLIQHIEMAFQAWRTWPWAKDLSFDAFCEHVLPYRGSNEPLEDWRSPIMARFTDIPDALDDPTDAKAAAGVVGSRANGWIGFWDLYYLHPTDQGFAEMEERRKGRCEDITNMQTYAWRAAAIASAQDYTPAWANRDNNHAWSVLLDENGRGSARQSNVAAKIYRKTFSAQRGNLAFQLREGEKAPPWLNRRTYMDVTDQYLDTTDVTVVLTNEPPQPTRFAYLCVFNGGEWVAIHWGAIADGRALFDRMGRNVAYLPAYYIDDELVPAASPFILDAEGTILRLSSDVDVVAACELTGEEGKSYELFVWEDGWRSIGRGDGGAAPMVFDGIPARGLYWLVADGSRRLERIFTLRANGTPRYM